MKLSAHLNLDQLILSPTQEWKPNRSGWHFLQVKEGQAYWLGNGVNIDLNQGELLVLSPTHEGQLRASSLGSVHLYSFRFSAELVPEFLTVVERQYLDRLASGNRMLPVKLPPEHRAATLLRRVGRESGREVNLEQKSLLLRVVSLSFDWSGKQQLARPGDFLPSSKRIKLVMDELTETDLCDMTVAGLAERCGCSVPYFNRLFRDLFGTSFRARQKEVRLIKARQLVVDTNTPIVEISRTLHFSSVRELSLQYKKEFGMAPREHRSSSRQASAEEESEIGSVPVFAAEAS